MKLTTLSKISLGLLLAYGSLAQAETAGRVLVAVGDVSAARGNRTIALKAGDEVQSGDTLRVGEASNMQVRFTDEGIVALRPNTVFRIDSYKFAKEADSDGSVFSLVKGGMRTITGLIGKLSRNNYAVKAPTATIGIRGTNYTVVACNNDCRNGDGSMAPNGTYGGVSDGRIVSSNEAGEREFGKNEFFHVASSNDLPKLLMSPPTFLRDRLEGEIKAGGKGKGPSTAPEVASSSTGTSGTSVTSTVTAAPATITPPTPYVPGEQPAVGPGSIPAVFQYAVAGAAAGTDSRYTYGYSETRGGEQVIVSLSGITADQLKAALAAEVSSPYVQNRGLLEAILGGLTVPSTILTNAWGYTVNYTDSSGYAHTETYDKGAAVDVGTSAAAGNVTWGRFHYTAQDVSPLSSYSDSAWEHLAVGDPVTAMPTSGTFQFNWVGGTSPTDSAGNVGTITSGGAWSVSFSTGNPTIQTVSGSPVTWSMPGGVNYSLSISSPTAIPTNTWTSTGTFSTSATGYSSIPVTVSVNTTPGSVSGYVTPAFTGSQAQGLALGINTYGSGLNTASVQVYKR